MIRIVASGDQHVDARHMGGELALLSQEVALDELMEAAARANVLLLLGDLTHTPRPSARAFAMWGKALAKAQRGGDLQIIAIAGNHEQDQVVGVLPYFDKAEQIRAITIPQIVSLEFHSVGFTRQERRERLDVACLPWLPDSHVRAAAGGTLTKGDVAQELTDAATKILRGFLAQRREGVPMILATHATIEGAETSSGWNMGYRPSTGYILEAAELEGFAMVLAGHVHKHQANATKPILYTGSLTPLDFSETEPKGYVVAGIDLENGAVEWKFEPLTNSPPKVGTLEKTVTDERGRGVLEALLSSYAWPTLSRFRLTCDEQTAREFPAARIREAMLAAGARMAQVELTVIRADRVRDPSLTDDLSPMTALEKYLEGRDVDVARIRELAKTAIADAVIDSGANGVGGDLRLTRLEAENFLGLARADVALDGGISTLFGPVGMGKSSTGCDIVRFALFGESRIGGKASERLIRQGATYGLAAVELEGGGDLYRVVRTMKRGAGGRVTTTLDVLGKPNDEDGDRDGFRALSSGKIADGETEITRILGGLTDDVLAVANLVVQRDADRFSAARPEERKRLIARAAGLDVFDTLASASRIRLSQAENTLRELHSAAQPLRDRADVLPRLEGDLVTSQAERDGSRAKAADLERQRIEISEDIELFRGKAATFEAAAKEYRAIEEEEERLNLDLRTWDSKRDLAKAVLEDKPKLETAQANLDEARERIVLLEAQVVADNAALARRAASSSQKSALELQLAGMKQRRLTLAREIGGKLDSANAQKERLAASECPVIDKIPDEIPPCRFLRDAVVDAAQIGTMERDLEKATEAGADEGALIARILDFAVPAAPDTKKTIDELALERTNARKLEALIAGSDRIARADQVVLEHTDATKKIVARLEELALKGSVTLEEVNKPDPRVDLEKRTRFLDDVDVQLSATRKDIEAATQRVGILEGRIETMREAKAELDALTPKISDVAQDIAGWHTLSDGWKACRVAVLENNVIPSLEDLANEVLRQFPYGIQISLETQRDRKSGEGVSETLEIEVLGAGQVYELCSGGQKTTIDLAFHVAIALLVSRRISTRLRFLYLDEPEGLDEPGRLALAGLVRWIHDTHGLTVILASHHEDLIDAVGGERIPFAGEPGNAYVGGVDVD